MAHFTSNTLHNTKVKESNLLADFEVIQRALKILFPVSIYINNTISFIIMNEHTSLPSNSKAGMMFT
jgi:hypothetical protein